MGKFWVPESAVGHKWRNFQPCGFKFGLYSLLLGISTWKKGKTNLGPICAPFGELTHFRGTKSMRSDNCRFGCSLHSKFFRYVLHNDVYNVAVCKFTISIQKGAYGNGAILGPRSVINGAIFNRSASNLVCNHYYLVSPPGKL